MESSFKKESLSNFLNFLTLPMADFSFGFNEGNFLLLNSQKHLKSVAEDLISNKQKRTKRIYQER